MSPTVGSFFEGLFSFQWIANTAHFMKGSISLQAPSSDAAQMSQSHEIFEGKSSPGSFGFNPHLAPMHRLNTPSNGDSGPGTPMAHRFLYKSLAARPVSADSESSSLSRVTDNAGLLQHLLAKKDNQIVTNMKREQSNVARAKVNLKKAQDQLIDMEGERDALQQQLDMQASLPLCLSTCSLPPSLPPSILPSLPRPLAPYSPRQRGLQTVGPSVGGYGKGGMPTCRH